MTRNRNGRKKGGKRTNDHRLTNGGRLTPDELAVLLKACERYRTSLPIYLQSAQPELSVVDALIRKLS